MKKLILLCIVMSLMTAACKKDDNGDSCNCDTDHTCINNICVLKCDAENWGEIFVSNLQEDPYSFYINGAYKGQVSAYGYLLFQKQASGAVVLKAEQVSGYLFYPTIYENSLNVNDCNRLTWILN